MPTQSQALQLMPEAIRAMRAAGYTQEDVQELVTAAFQHLEGDGHKPYAFAHCTNCNRLTSGSRPTNGPPSCASRAPGAASPGDSLPPV